MNIPRTCIVGAVALVMLASGGQPAGADDQLDADRATNEPLVTMLLAGETMAVAYSGFREGQHPDRGEGAVNPSRDEISEDLDILVEHGFRLIRLYDAGVNSAMTLEVIRERELPIKVLLGIWLQAESSNHEGCPWLDAPIPDAVLAANLAENRREVKRGIELAQRFPEIIVAVNVGNEALVDWTDHMVPLEQVIGYVRQVKDAIDQPVTVAENYEWWARHGADLAAELDFLGVHTYPVWEGKPIAILEAGWPTTAIEFGERAGELQQARYFSELAQWARETEMTVFFFEAFDEPWKGDPAEPLGAEKHWGLFKVDRTPKHVMRARDAGD